jgi:hypothetical protein
MKEYPEYKSKFMRNNRTGTKVSKSLLMEYSDNCSFCSNAELVKAINQMKKPNYKVYQQKIKDSLM